MAEDKATSQTGASGAEADGTNQPDNARRASAKKSTAKRSSGSKSKSSSSSSSSGGGGGKINEILNAILDHVTRHGTEADDALRANVHDLSGGKVGSAAKGTTDGSEDES